MRVTEVKRIKMGLIITKGKFRRVFFSKAGSANDITKYNNNYDNKKQQIIIDKAEGIPSVPNNISLLMIYGEFTGKITLNPNYHVGFEKLEKRDSIGKILVNNEKNLFLDKDDIDSVLFFKGSVEGMMKNCVFKRIPFDLNGDGEEKSFNINQESNAAHADALVIADSEAYVYFYLAFDIDVIRDLIIDPAFGVILESNDNGEWLRKDNGGKWHNIVTENWKNIPNKSLLIKNGLSSQMKLKQEEGIEFWVQLVYPEEGYLFPYSPIKDLDDYYHSKNNPSTFNFANKILALINSLINNDENDNQKNKNNFVVFVPKGDSGDIKGFYTLEVDPSFSPFDLISVRLIRKNLCPSDDVNKMCIAHPSMKIKFPFRTSNETKIKFILTLKVKEKETNCFYVKTNISGNSKSVVPYWMVIDKELIEKEYLKIDVSSPKTDNKKQDDSIDQKNKNTIVYEFSNFSYVVPVSNTFLKWELLLQNRLSKIEKEVRILNLGNIIPTPPAINEPIILKVILNPREKNYQKLDSYVYESLNTLHPFLQVVREITAKNQQLEGSGNQCLENSKLQSLFSISGIKNHHLILNIARSKSGDKIDIEDDEYSLNIHKPINEVINLFQNKKILIDETFVFSVSNIDPTKQSTSDENAITVFLKVKKFLIPIFENTLKLINHRISNEKNFVDKSDLPGNYIYIVDVFFKSNKSRFKKALSELLFQKILEHIACLVGLPSSSNFENIIDCEKTNKHDSLEELVLENRVYLYLAAHGISSGINEYLSNLDSFPDKTYNAQKVSFYIDTHGLIDSFQKVPLFSLFIRMIMFFYCNENPSRRLTSTFIQELVNGDLLKTLFPNLSLILGTYRKMDSYDINAIMKNILLHPLIIWNLVKYNNKNIIAIRNTDLILRLKFGGASPTPLGYSPHSLTRHYMFYLLKAVGWNILNSRYTHYIFNLNIQHLEPSSPYDQSNHQENNFVNSIHQLRDYGKQRVNFNFFFLKTLKSMLDDLVKNGLADKIVFKINSRTPGLYWECKIEKFDNTLNGTNNDLTKRIKKIVIHNGKQDNYYEYLVMEKKRNFNVTLDNSAIMVSNISLIFSKEAIISNNTVLINKNILDDNANHVFQGVKVEILTNWPEKNDDVLYKRTLITLDSFLFEINIEFKTPDGKIKNEVFTFQLFPPLTTTLY